MAKEGVQRRAAAGGAGGRLFGTVVFVQARNQGAASDHVFGSGDAKVLIDPKSFVYLDGLTLDYKESLIQSGFTIDNPNAEKTCSCGT
jgi:iron-sulfur cluster assembly protein